MSCMCSTAAYITAAADDVLCASGLADYYYNNECSEAVIYSTLNSAIPGIQVTIQHVDIGC